MKTMQLDFKKTFTLFPRLLFAVVVLLILIIFLQQIINYLSYDEAGPSSFVINPLMKIGLDESLGRAVYWYALQIAFSLILIKLFIPKSFSEIGFNVHNRETTQKIILWFIVVYTLMVALSWYVLYKLGGLQSITGGLEIASLSFVIKDLVVFGSLPGPGEEPLFRIFVIQLLIRVCFGGKPVSTRSVSLVLVCISALLFSAGHVFVLSFYPLQLKYDVVQLITAFVLGLFYAITYLKTKSILAAIVCHNYSDFVVRLGAYLLLSV